MGQHRGEVRVSRRARLLTAWLRRVEKPAIARAVTPGPLRRRVLLSAKIFFHPPRGTVFEDASIGALPATRVISRETRDGPLILYLHGGGYIFGAPRTHRAMVAQLAARTRLSAVLPQYRLAPEHAFPAALDDATAAYRAVMGHAGGIILGGDSAGGGLALALLARIRAEGLAQPKGTFCLSPLTDLTFSGESFVANASRDPLLPAHRAADMTRMYLQGAEPTDPGASPLFADFTGAGPVWLAAADTEILLDDTRRMANRLMEQGVDVTQVIERDLPHVWPLFHNIMPEARQTLGELTGWITSLSRL